MLYYYIVIITDFCYFKPLQKLIRDAHLLLEYIYILYMCVDVCA